MVRTILLNNKEIQVYHFHAEKVNNLHRVSVKFKVASKDYYEITTLLYERIFNVEVPEVNLAFKGAINQYSTSFTNLYKEGQIGDFRMSLLEVNKEGEEAN